MHVQSSLSPLLSAPPESLVAPPAPAPGPDFASLLRQSQSAAAPAPVPAPPPVAAPTPNAAADNTINDAFKTAAPAPAPTPENDATPPAPAPANGTDKTKSASPSPAPAPKPAAKATTDAADKADADGGTGATAGGVDPSIAAWLAQLHAMNAQATPATARGDDGATADTAADASAGVGGRAKDDVDLRADAADPSATRADADQNPAAFAGVLAETAAPARATAHKIDTIAGAAPTTFATPTATSGSQASTPTPVTVATPVDAPDFSQALGVHLAVLAKDGVQHAELHLNPADMGPVSVQISVDGTQARIDFGADMAATRHAIEAGLPELASALRDAGLTLTGGGVSQQSRGRSDDAQDPSASRTGGVGGARGGAGSGDSAAAQAVVRRTVALGGVDLYA